MNARQDEATQANHLLLSDIPYRLITERNELPELRGTYIAVDTETTGLSPREHELVLVSVCDGTQVVVCDVRAIGVHDVLSWLTSYFDNRHLIIGHNLAFDYGFLYAAGFPLPVHSFDTMLAETLLRAGLPTAHRIRLLDLAAQYCNVQLDKTLQRAFGGDITEAHHSYAADDVRYLIPIFHRQRALLERYNLKRVAKLEMSLIPIVAQMEYHGIPIKPRLVASLSDEVNRRRTDVLHVLSWYALHADAVTRVAVTPTGCVTINPNSKPTTRGEQIALGTCWPILARLGVPVVDQFGQPSLSREDVLRADAQVDTTGEMARGDIVFPIPEELTKPSAYRHPVLALYQQYIGLTKVATTYLEPLRAAGERYYGYYRQLGAHATGRFSSNLQQFPNDAALRGLGLTTTIRACIGYDVEHGAPDDTMLFIADYSAIELVILADMSGDEQLQRLIVASASGEDDLHLYVVRRAFASIHPQAPEATVARRKEEPFVTLRKAAKPVSYGIAYGLTGAGLAKTINRELASLNIHVTTEQAERIITLWKQEAFPQAGAWLDRAQRDGVVQGFTCTALGRRRWYPPATTPKERAAIMRQSCNAPIQGTCADLIKQAMVYVHAAVQPYHARIMMTVHDELVCEGPARFKDDIATTMKQAMERAARDILPSMGRYVVVDVHPSYTYDK
ncbi:MAG: hypothetical protein KatS3mg054_0292 [Chloroflexus sp.]|nr:MAG: hypothetical protein KatS3mg054_0292 [Chloroflexus sp.]